MKNPNNMTLNSFNIECYTPREAVEKIIPFLKKLKYKKLWLPFDTKESEFYKVLKKAGFECNISHIQNNSDFFTYTPHFEFDCIISNPPWKNKNNFVARAIEFNKPVMFLMSTFRLNAGLVRYNPNFLIFNNPIKYFGSKSRLHSAYWCFNCNLDRDYVLDTEKHDSTILEAKTTDFVTFNSDVKTLLNTNLQIKRTLIKENSRYQYIYSADPNNF